MLSHTWSTYPVKKKKTQKIKLDTKLGQVSLEIKMPSKFKNKNKKGFYPTCQIMKGWEIPTPYTEKGVIQKVTFSFYLDEWHWKCSK